LADYEHLTESCIAHEADLRSALAANPPRLYALLAFADEQPAGFATWYFTFSTFSGQADMFIEDLFVLPSYRRRGLGTQLFHELTRQADAANCRRLQWIALDWNKPALDFYREHGATAHPEWILHRLNSPRPKPPPHRE
jgi:GNAT superfamily N-acetyltransferase